MRASQPAESAVRSRGAEVARLLDRFGDQQERIGRRLELVERAVPGPGDAQEAVGAFAAADLLEGGVAQLTAVDAGGPGVGHEFGGLGAAEHRRTEIDFEHLDLALDGPGEFPEAFGDEQAAGFALGTVAQAGQRLHAGILSALDDLVGHGRSE